MVSSKGRHRQSRGNASNLHRVDGGSLSSNNVSRDNSVGFLFQRVSNVRKAEVEVLFDIKVIRDCKLLRGRFDSILI